LSRRIAALVRRIVGVLTLLVVAACGGDADTSARTQTESASSASLERSSDAACEVLTDLVAHESSTNFEDLEAMREAAPITAALLAGLAAAAPEEITADVDVLRDAVGDWQRTIENPEFLLEPDTSYVWQTAQSQKASQALIAWADDNCPAGIDAEALQPVTLTLCLPASADADDVQALFARTSTPSDTGRGEDLLEGVQSVSAHVRGVEVTLSRLISPEQKAELVAILGAPPVVEVIEGQGHASCEESGDS